MPEGVTAGITLLANRYEIGDVIGRGGMATVHVGQDTRLGRRVAVKLLKPSLANDPAFRTRFRQEAQAAARMAHPTIVRVYDAGEETVTEQSGAEVQVPFIVMEYVEGRPLSDIIGEGPVDPDEAVRITSGILTALEYSHRAGVVHRDIKPANVMVTHTGQVKVMDFGIARAITDTSATVAQTTSILGTASYFSPEQARGETVDARTDLYSTGIVLFELLTARPPFLGDSPVAVAYQHVSEQPVAPSTITPAVSPALDAVTLHALVKDRTRRFQNAAEFRRDLEQAAAGQVPASTKKLHQSANDASTMLFGVNPRTTSNPEVAFRELDDTQEHRPQRTQNRPPVAWIWVGIVLTIAVIAGVIFWVANLQPGQAPVSSSVSVPNVVGATYDSAENALKKRDLVAVRVDENSDKVDKGSVIRTEPGSGTNVARSQNIRVVVSLGPEQVAVPDVANQAQDAAQKALETAGFTIGAINTDYSPSVPEGTVMSSDPASGTTHTKGTVINLTVSNGMVQLPDVTQQPFATANSTLAGLGLKVTPQPSYSCVGGTVTQQDKPAGDVAQGSTVALTYCAASNQPTAPATSTPSDGDSGGNGGGNDDGGDSGNTDGN
ncbi:serine/threonine-protein kinase [Curtobacterium sp. PhB130]|uniref:Stk1 family PASTA domain-containing Ser/Thr kinase n=1 Tax=unclassified Curtobacterium TaxID=257496 RepID=UPI000FC22464|nr:MULTISPECIES: Stk1 family PASTA domain-containing Ser/Thr kinase [unclassified Curtobacterium]ROP63506.1 serine/threonine-protein kinase [Curtobacterium sp. ZW137]ROS77766.1 serine/threonine-protein kinase [Curtobacterium sp. PhB130]TCK66018.1 serine/threonine-protein kinase [Curtobacterium sp. PhB136]